MVATGGEGIIYVRCTMFDARCESSMYDVRCTMYDVKNNDLLVDIKFFACGPFFVQRSFTAFVQLWRSKSEGSCASSPSAVASPPSYDYGGQRAKADAWNYAS
jgi:hypothetical protein